MMVAPKNLNDDTVSLLLKRADASGVLLKHIPTREYILG